MTRTQDDTLGTTVRPKTTWTERLIVLGGFAVAALWTAVAAILGFGMETVGAAWLVAVLWTVPSSLALALRRGFVHRNWSAFAGHELPDDTDTIDWSTKSGSWYELAVLEDNERLMRGD